MSKFTYCHIVLYSNTNDKLQLNFYKQQENIPEKYKDAIAKCFLPNETQIILDWEKNEEKKIIEAFDNHVLKLGLVNLRQSAYKYLLFQYGESNNDIWNKLNNELKNNYHFILKIEELLTKNENSNLYKNCYKLVYNNFINDDFDISRKKHENEIVIDKTQLLQKYIFLLIGKYDELKKFIPITPPKDLEINYFKLFEVTAKQILLISNFPKNIIKDIYLLSLKQEIPFIDNFKKHQKYSDQFEKLISSYKEYYPNVKVDDEEISFFLDDLLAYQIFSNNDIKISRFLRYPLWLIIFLYYKEPNFKKDCYNAFGIFEKGKFQQNTLNRKDEISLLSTTRLTPQSLLSGELSDYFMIDEKDKKIKMTFSKGKINSLNNENETKKEVFLWQNITNEEKESILTFEKFVLTFIEKKMESIFKGFSKENQLIQNEKELLKIMKENLELVLKFLKINDIFSYGNVIEKELIEDCTKNRTIVITNNNLDIYYQIYIAIENRKPLPSFLKKCKLKDNNLKKFLAYHAKFLQNNDYMESVLVRILKYQEQNEMTSFKYLQHLNSYIKEHIIPLNLLYKIQQLLPKNQERNKDSNNNNNDLFSQLFEELMKKFDIKNNSLKFTQQNLEAIYKYSNELSRRIKSQNIDFLNLKLYMHIFNSVTEEKDFFNSVTTLLLNGNINLLNNNQINLKLELKRQINKNKFIVELLNISYNFYKLDKNKGDSPQNILSFLFTNPQYNYEAITLYLSIIRDIIPLQLNKETLCFNLDDKKDIFENINSQNLKIISLTLPSNSKTNVKINDDTFLNNYLPIIQCMEKYFLEFIYLQNIKIFTCEKIKQTFHKSMKYVAEFNDHLINKAIFGPIDLFKYLISIAYLKVFFQGYLECFYEEYSTSNCSYYVEHFEKKENEISIKIMQIYILKLIRNFYVHSFKEFKAFNFSQIQQLWVSNYKFREKYETDFEYLFFSDWDDSSTQRNSPFCFFEEYNDLLSVFVCLREESFRTSKFDDTIIQVIMNDKLEMYIDLIMNEILCKTDNNDYLTNLEYIEFCAWSKHLNMVISKANYLEKEKVTFLKNLSQNNGKEFYSLIINSIKNARKINIDSDCNLIDLEIIFISLKFVLANIYKKFTFITNNKIKTEDVKLKLIFELHKFIVNSLDYYKEEFKEANYNNGFEEKKNKANVLLNQFPEIVILLRQNNINQIKLFMNFLYYRLRNSQGDLSQIIENAINDWPKQSNMINKYYEFVNYNDENIRNYLLDERTTPEFLNKSTYNIQSTKVSGIPVFQFFYYEKFPSWKDFINQCSSKINKEHYPYIYFFSEEDNYYIYQRTNSTETISNISSNHLNKDYFDFKYSGFKSLNDLAVFYSKSYVFTSKKNANPNLGYVIEYDIDEIERELSTIEFVVVENEKY